MLPILAIIACSSDAARLHAHDAEKRYFPPCGVDAGGTLYLAVPDPNGNLLKVGERDRTEVNVMFLVIVDAAAMVGLG